MRKQQVMQVASWTTRATSVLTFAFTLVARTPQELAGLPLCFACPMPVSSPAQRTGEDPLAARH